MTAPKAPTVGSPAPAEIGGRASGRGRIPLVSVGVPVYNGEQFLPAALDAILGQTFQDYEIVISDNASDDGTEEICRRYAARDPRIRYSRHAINLGANPNFNRVVELSRGRYFKLANADDLSKAELLSRCVAVLDDHPEVALCYGQTTLIREDGAVLSDYDDNLDLRFDSAAMRFRAVVERIGLVNVLQGVMRSDVLKRTSLLRDYPGADIILVAELALHGQFWELPERLFLRRMHPGAASALKVPKAKQEYVAPLKKRGPLYLASRRYLGHLSSVSHAPLSGGEKLALVAWLMRSAVSERRELAQDLVYACRGAWESLMHRRRG